MPVSAAYTSKVTVTEVLTDALLEDNSSVVHDGLDTVETYNAATDVPATLVASFEKAMSAGAGTIDLRALTGTNGGAIDGNGLKVQVIKLRNKASNANAITITGGASNGYLLFGASGSIILPVGAELLLNLNESAPDISGTTKTIDIAGTGSQVLEVTVVMG